MTTVTLAGTQALMSAREVSVILATGGLGLVRAAYSAGKPAYGVGPGNAPCYVESSADVAKAADDIVAGKAFDHGVLCSSPNAVVVDRAIAPALRAALARAGGHFLSAADADRLGQRRWSAPSGCRTRRWSASRRSQVAGHVGITVPAGTRALLAELGGRRPRLPAVDRKAVPGARLLRGGRLARRLRAVYPDPALRRTGAHDVDPLAERRRDPRVRPCTSRPTASA